MNKKTIPTTKELFLKENDLLTSKTDAKGNITYCNEMFILISGYDEAELINQPHNIVRHPDMPCSVYRLLWETVQKQQEFFGIIKNLCKNGSYYWVFANITPRFDENNQLVDYFSARRQPSRQIIDTLTPIYQQMLAEEAKHNDSQQAMDASIKILNEEIAQQGLTYNEFIVTHA